MHLGSIVTLWEAACLSSSPLEMMQEMLLCTDALSTHCRGERVG